MSDQQPPESGDAPTPPPVYNPTSYSSYPSYPGDAGSGDGPGDPGYGAAPGQPEPFSRYEAGEAWLIGFRLFGKHAAAFLLLGVLAIVIAVGFSLLGFLVANHGHLTNADGSFTYSTSFNASEMILQIVGGVISTLLTAALIKGAFDAVDGRPVSIGGMFEGWDKLQVLLASIVVNILVGIGVALLIIPGVIVAFLTWFTNYFIVASGTSAFAAIGEAVNFTTKNFGALLVTALLAAVTLIAGACLCGVGLFVALPVSVLMAAVAFRQLQGRTVVTR